MLVRRHEKTIFNLVYRMLGDYDEAAEVSQEVFLSAYRAIGQFRGDANFSTWLYRIALNHTSTRRKTLIRRQQRNVAIEDTEPVRDLQPGPAETMEKKEIRERVQRALNSLEPDDATVILLRDLQDIPYEEVARLLEAVQATLRTWIDRLREETGDAFPEKVTAFHDGMAVHGRFKQPCPVCGTPIQRIVYAENETNYCPRCQTGGKLLADRSLSRLLRDDWPKTVEELEDH